MRLPRFRFGTLIVAAAVAASVLAVMAFIHRQFAGNRPDQPVSVDGVLVSPPLPLPPSTPMKLTLAEAVGLARAAAIARGIDPSEYRAPYVSFSVNGKDWFILFDLKPPSYPGGHFSVEVDDSTKETRFVPGA